MTLQNRAGVGFTDDIPGDDDGLGFPISRVPAGGTVKGVILSRTLTCRRTHWFGGRTVPCHPDGCRACESNVEGRWHAWVAVHDVKREATVILELTARAIPPLRRWLEDFGTLRGAEITVNRIGKNENGRLFASLTRGPVAHDLLPSAPDVQRLLLKMWGLEQPLPEAGHRAPDLSIHRLNGNGVSK